MSSIILPDVTLYCLIAGSDWEWSITNPIEYIDTFEGCLVVILTLTITHATYDLRCDVYRNGELLETAGTKH